jgi:fluoroquinolone transport system permease protein
VRFVRAFALNDLRSIPREPLIVFLLFAPWAYVFALRLALPAAGQWLAMTYGVAIADYHPLIMTAYTLPIPLFVGLVYGLLLLDERDDRVFPAIQVTRVSLEAYLVYRVLVSFCISIPYSTIYAWSTGLVPSRAAVATLPALVLGAVISAIIMLSLVAFASNKVEGLAFSKVVGVAIMFGPLVAFFWRSPWQLVLGIIPSYWPAKAYWLLYQGEPAWGYIAAGTVYGLFICATLGSIILRKMKTLT